MPTVQLGVIGAMQRAHPALTQLWLQWTGIPDLPETEFRLSRAEERGPADTTVLLPAKPGIQAGWTKLCDTMGLPVEAAERRSMPMRLLATSPCHAAFWHAMRQREMTEVDGPLEWWWRLLVLRTRDLKRASRKLAVSVFGEDQFFDNCVLYITNPSISKEGRRADNLITKSYATPTHITITRSVNSKSKTEGLAWPLNDDKLRSHFTSHLIGLSIKSMS